MITMITADLIERELAKAKPYTVLFLTRGANFVTGKAQADAIRQKHFGYAFQLKADGIILMIFGTREDGLLRTIEVFATVDRAEAERLVQQDPGVQAGHFGYEIH